MLLITLYSVFIFLLSASAVRIFRNLPWKKRFNEGQVGRVETDPKMTLRAKQGFISLETNSRKNKQERKHRRGRTDVLRVPWGW